MKKTFAIIFCILAVTTTACGSGGDANTTSSSSSSVASEVSSSTSVRKNPLTIVAENAKPAIDEWIEENELSEWGRNDGDVPSKDMLYDEDLGRAMTNYEYIIKNNPSKISMFVSRSTEIKEESGEE
jgi:ABC-type enterochelin transport system substrate-binding protein